MQINIGFENKREPTTSDCCNVYQKFFPHGRFARLEIEYDLRVFDDNKILFKS